MSRNGLLLDTCAVIYAALGRPMRAEASASIEVASREGRLHVSPIVAWELGLLTRAGTRNSLFTAGEAGELVRSVFARRDVIAPPLSPDILFASSHLPGTFHRDPADRIHVATARLFNLTLATDDREIIAYAAQGHLQVLEV